MSNDATLPANLTAYLNKSVTEVQLPTLYEAARKAIEECAQLDECKDWADKAAALRAYAVMRDDAALTNYAQRIHLRSVRRCGELLKQIEPANGARTDLGRAPTRGCAADAAGLSEHQRKTAIRVANVSEDQFRQRAEGDAPTTVTALAELGKQKSAVTWAAHVEPINTPEYTAAITGLGIFADFCATNPPADLAKGRTFQESRPLRRYALDIQQWLTRFIGNLST